MDCIKLQELITNACRDTIKHSRDLHVLAWSENCSNIDDFVRSNVWAGARRDFLRGWAAGRIQIHTCWRGVEDDHIHEWLGFDQLLAYTSEPPVLAEPARHRGYYVCQNLTQRRHRDYTIQSLIDSGAGRLGRISYGYRQEPQPENNGRGRPPSFPGITEHCWPGGAEQFQLTNPVDIPPPPVNIWRTTAFNIITETHCDEPGSSFTEKTWQAVWLGRPFLIIGVPGVHQQLRDLGYQLMLDFDYSWDAEPNWQRRIERAARAVMDYCRTYKPWEIVDINRSRVDHNRRRCRKMLLKRGLPRVCEDPRAEFTPGAAHLVEYLRSVMDALRSEL